MAWPELARLLLRPEARQPEVWRARWAFGLVFLAAGFWSAVAPQINFSLGERLHLAFRTITGIAVGLALLTGLRYPPRVDSIIDIRMAEGAVSFARGANDLLVALPLFLLLLALQSIEVRELIIALTAICVALIVSTTVSTFKGPVLLLPIAALAVVAMQRRNGFESLLVSVYAAHLYFKSRVAFKISAEMRSPNRVFEMATPLNARELCDLRQRSFAASSFLLVAFSAMNLVFLLLANFWPVKLEDKLPLAFVFGFGIVSLYLDTFALKWRSMYGNPLLVLAGILGIPWAVAWAFAALHTGEALTLNEWAAYFFLWMALGSTLSWVIGGAAKQKALRDFRELAVASPSPFPSNPSGKAP